MTIIAPRTDDDPNAASLAPSGASGTREQFTYEIVGYDELPIANIRPNPDNPRPTFHLPDDDPNLLALGDSIRTTRQHRPALVFELVNHFAYPDEPGHYMLLQGERRYRACKISGVDTLNCLIARTPKSKIEEASWLGNEEAFKEDWGLFFVLRYAKSLADELHVAMAHADIVSRTGLTRDQLRDGQKLFALEPEIQALVAEYEELKYRERGKGRRGRIGRLVGVETREFSVAKAAHVYDIFCLLREYLTEYCSQWDNAELQRRIAAKNSSFRELESISSMLRESGGQFQSGDLTHIDKYLRDDDYSARQLLRVTGSAEAGRFKRFLEQAKKVSDHAHKFIADVDQLGTNEDTLKDAQRVLLKLAREVDHLERRIAHKLGE